MVLQGDAAATSDNMEELARVLVARLGPLLPNSGQDHTGITMQQLQAAVAQDTQQFLHQLNGQVAKTPTVHPLSGNNLRDMQASAVQMNALAAAAAAVAASGSSPQRLQVEHAGGGARDSVTEAPGDAQRPTSSTHPWDAAEEGTLDASGVSLVGWEEGDSRQRPA
jgi:hypothetical protein